MEREKDGRKRKKCGRERNGAELRKWSGVKEMERSKGNQCHDPKGAKIAVYEVETTKIMVK